MSVLKNIFTGFGVRKVRERSMSWFLKSGTIVLVSAKMGGSAWGPKTARYFLLQFIRPDFAFVVIISEWIPEVIHERQWRATPS